MFLEFGIKSDVLLKTELQLVESSLCNYRDIYEEKICAGGFQKLHTCRGNYFDILYLLLDWIIANFFNFNISGDSGKLMYQ